MPTNGMTIDSLNTVSSLTAQDEVPVWDKEASGEPTRKITAQNMANSVKTLGSLVNTTEMNAAIAQSTAKSDGNFTLSYDFGTYTGGLTNQEIRYSARGDIVVLTGTFKMGGTADASHMYASFSGMPIAALRQDTLGVIRCSNDGKLCNGIKTTSNPTSRKISDVIMFFRKVDGTYLTEGETVEITLVYVKE